MQAYLKLTLTTLVVVMLFAHDKTAAAAFAIIENSARGQGMAFAGGGAIAEDASAAWFNPAGIVRLENQLQVSGSYIMPSFKFSDRNSIQETPEVDLPLLPASKQHSDGGQYAFVPNLYFVNAFNDQVYLGIAVNAPFGLVTEYNDDWVGRYQAVESSLKTLNVNPSIAWKIDSHWSAALGVSVDYIDVRLTNAVDFATVCAAEVLAVCPNGALPGQGGFDGFVSNTGDDLSLGANFGLMWSSANTRLSFAYRSQIKHRLQGTADFSTPSTLGGLAALPEPLAGDLSAAFADSNIKADVTLPDSAAFGFYRQLTPQWAVTGDFTWTDWADIQSIKIRFDNPLTPTGVEQFGFDSAWRYALGVEYRPNDRWTFRSGTAFDESPTPNAALRSSRLPDADRSWMSLGVSYQVDQRYSIDFGYSHLFVRDVSIDRLGATQDRLTGDYDSSADIVSLQLNARF